MSWSSNISIFNPFSKTYKYYNCSIDLGSNFERRRLSPRVSPLLEACSISRVRFSLDLLDLGLFCEFLGL